MPVLLKETHDRIVNNLKRKARKIHLFMGLFILCLLSVFYFYRIERETVLENYETIQGEMDTMRMKHELLQILRRRNLTIGQAIDIMEAVVNQKKIPIPIILAIIEQESQFRIDAISNKGARGAAQLMPAIWRHYGNGVNIHDPLSNITASINYLYDLQNTLKDWKRTLRSYYGGPNRVNDKSLDGYVRSVLAKVEKYEKHMMRR